MASTFANRAKMSVSGTPGAGAITLGAAIAGYQTFAAAGIADGNVVSYAIEDGTAWEVGTGTYTSSGTTLSRTVVASSNSGSAISATSNAIVYLTALAADLNALRSSGASGQVQYGDGSGNFSASGSLTYNGTNLIAGNDIIVAAAGGYGITVGHGYGGLYNNLVVGADGSLGSASLTGGYNTAMGFASLSANTSGSGNIAIGYASLASNTTGHGNTAVGSYSGYGGSLALNTTGYNNVAVGANTLYSNISGYQNVAIGPVSLSANTSGYSNVAVGVNALKSNTVGNYQTAIGWNALASYADTGASLSGNIAITGGYPAALSNLVSGTGNIALGPSLNSLTAGNNNVAIGNALPLSTAASCLAIGGNGAGYSNTTGTDNVFLGNTLCGYGGPTTGNSNIVMGSYAKTANGSDFYSVVISPAGNPGKGSNTAFIDGTAGAYNGANSANWSTTSDYRIKTNIHGIAFALDNIRQLHPATFEYRESGKSDAGFIAQQYEMVYPEQIITHPPNHFERHELGITDDVKGIQQNLVPYLVRALQELADKFDHYVATHP